MYRCPNFIAAATVTLMPRGYSEHINKKAPPFYANKRVVVCIRDFTITPRI